MKITTIQKEFLLKSFFKNEKYAGWRNVAEKLIDTGKCITSGTECIWNGGIGNYISLKPADGAVDCSEYTFNLKSFLQSGWFKLYYKEYLKIIKTELDEKQKQYDEINNLINL